MEGADRSHWTFGSAMTGAADTLPMRSVRRGSPASTAASILEGVVLTDVEVVLRGTAARANDGYAFATRS